ncbi:MAG: hypothetical protein Q9208_002769 [Pyrenodesmia sp. 3 TL-2023]
MVEADIADKPFSAAAHLGEQDIGDIDAPGEEVEDDPPSEASSEPFPPKRKRGRPRKNPPAPSQPKVSSPLAITSTVRRHPTPAEREEAKRLAHEAEDAVNSSWNNRAAKKALRVKRDRYRDIANGGWIEATPSAAVPKKATGKKRPVAPSEDEHEYKDLDEMGNTPAHAQYLEKKRRKYIKDHPEIYNRGRRQAKPKPETDSESDDYPVKPRTVKKVLMGRDEEGNETIDYDAMERQGPRMCGTGDPPFYTTYRASLRGELPPRSTSPDNVTVPTLRRKATMASDPYDHDDPVSQTQLSASASHTLGRSTSQPQSQDLTAFEQRLKDISKGHTSFPTRHYPPGFSSDVASTATFGPSQAASTATFGRSQVERLSNPMSSPSTKLGSNPTIGHPMPTTTESSSRAMAPPRRRRREPAIAQPEGPSGHIPNVMGHDYENGRAMKQMVAVNKAFRYEKDGEGEAKVAEDDDDDAVEGAKEEEGDKDDEEKTESENEE